MRVRLLLTTGVLGVGGGVALLLPRSVKSFTMALKALFIPKTIITLNIKVIAVVKKPKMNCVNIPT